MLRPALVVALVLAITGSPASAGPGAAQARVDAAAKAYDVAAAYQSTEPTIVYRWSVAWLDAQRDLPLKGKALAGAAKAHLDRMIALETAIARLVETGQLPTREATFAAYYRAEAELWVERKGKR